MPQQHYERKCSYLKEVSDHVDIGPRGRHKHTEGKTGIDLLQVLLCRWGSGKEC